jgi:hypothetical protein
MSSFDKRRFAVVCLAISAAVPVLAQTTPGTCTTPPQPPTVFNIERAFTFTNALSTKTPTLNAQIQAALTSGALEARQKFVLSTDQKTITVTEFVAAPGSPSPTTPTNISSANTLSVFTFNVVSAVISCSGVLYAGNITNNFPVSPFGNVSNTPGAISIGYTSDNPPKINNVVLVYSGIADIYSAAGVGTITFPAGGVTPPGSGGNAPVIVFSPAATQTTAIKQLFLDASKSTSPLNLQLTYMWRQVNMNIAAGLNNATTATPLVTFAGGKGDYVFEVTVTDSQGNSSKAQTTITYTGI